MEDKINQLLLLEKKVLADLPQLGLEQYKKKARKLNFYRQTIEYFAYSAILTTGMFSLLLAQSFNLITFVALLLSSSFIVMQTSILNIKHNFKFYDLFPGYKKIRNDFSKKVDIIAHYLQDEKNMAIVVTYFESFLAVNQPSRILRDEAQESLNVLKNSLIQKDYFHASLAFHDLTAIIEHMKKKVLPSQQILFENQIARILEDKNILQSKKKTTEEEEEIEINDEPSIKKYL